ncbi:MAG: hypothetical protein PHO07_09095 [Pirellulales bacterium]|jgi:hypothetical protein|nr:hypothetical protein [Thermoguttaceae bacterium]MDD4787316.1 hypothetical protein [Pirellulales bacterium]
MGYRRSLIALSTWAGAVVAVALMGCGGDKVPMAKVHGVVTFAGSPLEKGTITFLPTDGKGATAGGEIANGEFSVLVPPGPKRIEVRSPKVVGTRKEFEDVPNSPTLEIFEESIPPSYNVNSTLTQEVTMPETQIDLDLKDDGAKR